MLQPRIRVTNGRDALALLRTIPDAPACGVRCPYTDASFLF